MWSLNHGPSFRLQITSGWHQLGLMEEGDVYSSGAVVIDSNSRLGSNSQIHSSWPETQIVLVFILGLDEDNLKQDFEKDPPFCHFVNTFIYMWKVKASCDQWGVHNCGTHKLAPITWNLDKFNSANCYHVTKKCSLSPFEDQVWPIWCNSCQQLLPLLA